MPGPLVAGIAGSIGSAVIQRNAANSAQRAQTKTADQQIAETRRQFDVIQGLLRPYVEGGNVALQAQLDLMGIGGSTGTAPAITEVAGTKRAPGMFTVGGQSFATRAEAEAYANSQRTGGVSAQDAQRAAIDRLAGGEQFRALTEQGEYGMMANAAATGGLRGGDMQGALAQFRPQMLQSLIDRQLANLGGVAANGQSAAGMTGTAAQNAGAMVNQSLADRGAAIAGGALARGQAFQNAGSGILNTLGMMAQPLQPGGGPFQQWRF